jgi:hypothetical protein
MLLGLELNDGTRAFGLGIDWRTDEQSVAEINNDLKMLFSAKNFLMYLNTGGRRLIVYLTEDSYNSIIKNFASSMINKHLSDYSVDIEFEKLDAPESESVESKVKLSSIEDVSVILGKDYKSHWEDAEHFWDISCYAQYVSKLLELSDGEVIFDKIDYEIIGDNKEYVIKFVKENHESVLLLENMGDWLDFSFFSKLNFIIKESGVHKGFYPIVPDKAGDQTLTVVYTSRGAYEVLNDNGFVLDYIKE